MATPGSCTTTRSPTPYPVNPNTAIGLPAWVNHIAFDAASIEELYETSRPLASPRWPDRRQRSTTILRRASLHHRPQLATHMVEFCHTTRPFTRDAERNRAEQAPTRSLPSPRRTSARR